MKFIDRKTDGGRIKGKIGFYCNCLDVTRQGFYRYLRHRDDPWKYEEIAEKMRDIVAEDEYNDTYGRCRMREALALRYPNEKFPGERTIYRIMEKIGLSHRPATIHSAKSVMINSVLLSVILSRQRKDSLCFPALQWGCSRCFPCGFLTP